MSYRRVVGALGLLLFSAASLAEPLTVGQVMADLQYFRDTWTPREKSFTPETRQQSIDFINNQIASAHPMGRADLALVFPQAAAFSGNNHTLIYLYDVPGLFHSLPFSFWWFSEGAVVTRTHPEYRQLLGARIVSVGGVPIREAASRVERFIAGIASHKRYLSPLWLTRIESLQAIGVARDGRADFQFALPTGKKIRESLGIAPTVDPDALSPVWLESVVPDRGAGSWPQILDDIKELPMYLQPPTELSWRLLRDGSVLYVRSTSLSSHKVDVSAYHMVDELINSGQLPRAVVVDLRYNEGGDFFNVLNLANEILKMTEPRGGIYVITGRATNSAAIIFTALLKGGAPSRTKVVGEEISDRPWFWSEGATLTAPNSGIPLNYTGGYHDWAHGCVDLSKCYWPVVYFGVKAGSLDPDIPVDMSIREYIRGKDPALEAVLADLDAASGSR